MTKNPDAVLLGKFGGRIGGLARAQKLSKARRVEIAKKAAQTRWGNTVTKENRVKELEATCAMSVEVMRCSSDAEKPDVRFDLLVTPDLFRVVRITTPKGEVILLPYATFTNVTTFVGTTPIADKFLSVK